MSEVAVKEYIIDPMLGLFFPPRQSDEAHQAKTLREYVDALKHFGAEDLRPAWTRVRDTYQKASWPPIALFVLAASNSRKERQPAPQRPAVKRGEGIVGRVVWGRLRATPTAATAAAEGWAGSLRAKVLDGTIRDEGSISVVSFRAAHRRAMALADRLRDPNGLDDHGRPWSRAAVDALRYWNDILAAESDAAREVALAQDQAAMERTF